VVAETADIQEQVVQLYRIQAAFINPGTKPLGDVVPRAKTWPVLRKPASPRPCNLPAARRDPWRILGDHLRPIIRSNSRWDRYLDFHENQDNL
jgi:hypothetical protein